MKAAHELPRVSASHSSDALVSILEHERVRRGIQLETVELMEILGLLNPPADFLVFGLGNDASLWQELNGGGRTVFIEDDAARFERATRMHPSLEAYRVDYGTVRESWKRLLAHPEALWLQLPEAIADERWDVILVDGPAGCADGAPGRMKSIYMASQLVRCGGTVFVHDAEREIEAVYSQHFLEAGNLQSEVRGRALLQSYRMR